MIENAHVETAAFVWLIAGVVLWIAVPVAAALIWKVKKKEPVTSILVGAAAFLLFALILEKPIQNVLAFPTAMGLPEHTVSRFLNANPVLLALVAGLFPGVFEETGRLIAFKTVLRNRRNRETSISYGIGHGGFEVILILGLTYIQYIVYAVMINTGTFGMIVDQVAAQAPEQLGSVCHLFFCFLVRLLADADKFDHEEEHAHETGDDRDALDCVESEQLWDF